MLNFYQWLEARPTIGGFGDVFGLHGMRWNTPEEQNMWNIIKADPQALAAYKRVVGGANNDHDMIKHALKRAYEMAIQKHIPYTPGSIKPQAVVYRPSHIDQPESMPYTPGQVQPRPTAYRSGDNWAQDNTDYTEPADTRRDRLKDAETPEAKAERYRKAAEEEKRRQIMARRGMS